MEPNMSQDQTSQTGTQRNIWVRGLYMLLMGFAYQVVGTLVCIVTVMQFIVRLLSDAPNARLLSFGRHLGRYLQQIVNFETFASEEVPFPFSDWPSVDSAH
jgi:hypothetical protein